MPTRNEIERLMNSSRRIMIIGQPGSGKSTLARELGQILKLPVVHIDKIHWQSGWVERPDHEKDRLCAEVHASEEWIFEGGRSVTWPERVRRADTIVWLDVPLPVRGWRVFSRTVKCYGRSRPDLPDGCPERFNREFIKWIWATRNTNREAMQALFDSVPPEKLKVRLKSSLDVEAYLSSAENACSA